MSETDIKWFSRIWLVVSSLFVLGLLGLILFGCNGTTYDEPVVNPGGGGDSLTYKGVISALIASKCLACHGPGPKDLSSLTAVMKYVVPGSPQASKLCIQVSIGKMPPNNPLPQASIDDICEWIANGAPA